MKQNKMSGFSLVELLVAISIAAILAGLAAPSFQQMMVSSRMTSQANEFLTALNFTRSEAIKRNIRVTMCKSSSGTDCATSGDWQQGWLIFVDPAGSGTVGVVDSGEAVLRVHPSLTQGSTLVGSTAVASFLAYLPNGQASQTGQWDLCGPITSVAGRDIVIGALSGPARVVRDEPPVSCN